MLRASLAVLLLACTGDNPAIDPDDGLPCANADGADQRYIFERNSESGNILWWSRSTAVCLPIYESTEGTEQTANESNALKRAIDTWNAGLAECGEQSFCLSYNGLMPDSEGFGLDNEEPYKNLVTYVADRETWNARHPDLTRRPPVGLTTLWSTPDGEIFDADIEINTAYYNFSTNPEADQMDLQSVLLHELGHVLGFDHVTFVGSIMQEALNPGQRRRGLGPSDKDGLCAAFTCY